MAKKTDSRANIELKCSECSYIIRPTEKNKRNTPDKLEIKKYCPKCRKTVVFKEKKFTLTELKLLQLVKAFLNVRVDQPNQLVQLFDKSKILHLLEIVYID